MKKRLIITASLILILISIIALYNHNKITNDEILYNSKKYIYLDYKEDIFYYYYNNIMTYEEDTTIPVEHSKWNFVFSNEDLFVLKKHYKEASKYYKDDKNYTWQVTIEEDNKEITKELKLSQHEINQLYDIETQEKETIIFEDIEKFASIQKISKDKMITGIITIIYYKNSWYYKTEIMTEDDREYIIKLPNTITNKINLNN